MRRYFPFMRRFCFPLMFGLFVAMVHTVSASSGKIVKVLPHFLDAKGRHTLSPSLFERDAYQAQLRAHPEQRSGIRYDIHWRARASWGELKLKVKNKLERPPMSVVATLVYDEQLLSLPTDGPSDQPGSLPLRSVRYYEPASAVIKIGKGGVKPALRDDRRLLGMEASGPVATLFSPQGPLTREELDHVDPFYPVVYGVRAMNAGPQD